MEDGARWRRAYPGSVAASCMRMNGARSGKADRRASALASATWPNTAPRRVRARGRFACALPSGGAVEIRTEGSESTRRPGDLGAAVEIRINRSLQVLP
jgi:hypothetical protein